MDIRNLFKNEQNMIEFSSGEILFKLGKSANFMYIIMEGEIDIQYNG